MYEQVDIFPFEMLVEEHGTQKYADISQETIKKYKGVLPEVMLAVWERHGLTSHGEGEIWFVNPDDFEDITQAFFGKQHKFTVFARHSLGFMYAVMGNATYVIHPQVARAVARGSLEGFDFLLAGLINPENQRHTEHRRALGKLGPITSEQMYGYVPMLALGGDGSLEETQIVTLREYLLLVADVATEAKRNGWNPLGFNEVVQ